MKQILSGKWKLQGFLPNIPFGKSEESISHHIITDEIEATVPGGIHLDLYRAGIIPNPYYEKNSLACEWTESRWWCYQTEIELLDCEYKKKELVFEGLDCLSEIYIDGVSYGEHDNAFTPMRIDISYIQSEKIKILVVLKGAGSENGQNGKTSETRTQKSRFGYKWDFGTRLVNIGIWQDVYIEYTNDARLYESRIETDAIDGVGIINASFNFEGETEHNIAILLKSPNGDVVYSSEVPFENYLICKIKVENPMLWYPNGMGEQPLYTLYLNLGDENYEYKVGIRRLRYLQNPGSPENAITYTIEINGKPVYIKGNNKVPLDHLYGNVSAEDYEWFVKAMVNENVNLVRVWGGGIIETEAFYNLCDKYGILVWQDFIQSSSGIDHIPSKHKDFMKKLSDAATHALKIKRNHVALTIWTGGNELTDDNIIPATYKDENIAMLRELADREDSTRLFLPTTPSGPIYTTVFTSEDNHDVHSPWEYNPKTHYENYNRLKLLLHSEFGISAMTEFMPVFAKENTPDAKISSVNHHHGEHWWHSYRRDKNIYGEFECANDYILYSQWTQAEGLRYVIEAERRLAPYASGSMVWQINEPWPNCDCTNLIDYFGNPKMAYYWVKKAFSHSDVSLKYSGISVDDRLEATICLNGDSVPSDERCHVAVYDAHGNIICFDEYKTSELPQKISMDINDTDELVFVRISHKGIDKDYFFSKLSEFPYSPARSFKKTDVKLSLGKIRTDGDISYVDAEAVNIGDSVAYFVHPIDENMEYAMLCDDAYFQLLPGECRKIKIMMKKRCGLFFDKTENAPRIILHALNMR